MWGIAIAAAAATVRALADPNDPARADIVDMWQDAKSATREFFDEKEAAELARAEEIVADPVNASAVEIQEALRTIRTIESRRIERAEKQHKKREAAAQREVDKVKARFEGDTKAEARTKAEHRAKAEQESNAASDLVNEAKRILANPMSTDADLQFARGVMARFGGAS